MDCLRVTTAYLSTKLEGGGDVDTSIWNGKVFELVWTNPVGPTAEYIKAMLQVEYGTREKRLEKLRRNLSTEYGLVLGQRTKYLRSQIEGRDKWEEKSNKRNLLDIIKSIKYLLHKYDKDT